MWHGLSLELGADVVWEGLWMRQGGVWKSLWLLTDVVVVIAHPLFTAAPRRPGQPGLGAAPVWEGHLMWAEWHAAHHPIHAATLVLAAGLEVLSVLVHTPTELTGPTLGLRTAQSSLRVSPRPQVAVQAFDVVAGLAGAAVFIELLGTHLTAATLVCHPANARRTGGRHGGAGARRRAVTLHHHGSTGEDNTKSGDYPSQTDQR